MTAFLTIFRRFPNIPQILSEGHTNVAEHFPKISEEYRRFPKVTEDCQRLSRKTRRCFDDTPTNLSTIYETNLVSVKSSISSLVRMWKICHLSPGCGFIWILRVVYFLVKHLCLYNKRIYEIHTPYVNCRITILLKTDHCIYKCHIN